MKAVKIHDKDFKKKGDAIKFIQRMLHSYSPKWECIVEVNETDRPYVKALLEQHYNYLNKLKEYGIENPLFGVRNNNGSNGFVAYQGSGYATFSYKTCLDDKAPSPIDKVKDVCRELVAPYIEDYKLKNNFQYTFDHKYPFSCFVNDWVNELGKIPNVKCGSFGTDNFRRFEDEYLEGQFIKCHNTFYFNPELSEDLPLGPNASKGNKIPEQLADKDTLELIKKWMKMERKDYENTTTRR